MHVQVASTEAFRQVHALLFLSVEAPIPSTETSRVAASVHGSVRAAVMERDSTEHPLLRSFLESSRGSFSKRFGGSSGSSFHGSFHE